jgi:hypothetical protein
MIDRATQRRSLKCLREHYPAGALPVKDLDLTDQQAAANLKYLEELGLCDSGVMIGADGYIAFGSATITAAGLDFLEDDGGYRRSSMSSPSSCTRTQFEQ